MTTLRQDVEIINKLGLHARASAKFTQLAGTFQSEVWLERNGRRVNGKSIMGVMMLAAGKGTTVAIETIGDDAEPAMQALVGLINDYFGEGE
jgi:phosphocarrier protein HPr